MSSLLNGPLDFSLSPLSALSTTRLALARLHPDFDEGDALRVCQLYFHRREKARRYTQERAGRGGNPVDQSEDLAFALVGLDFALDGKLEDLSDEQLAAVVVLAHPDASELAILKAERIWRKRREKAALTQSSVVHNDQRSTIEESKAPRPEPTPASSSSSQIPDSQQTSHTATAVPTAVHPLPIPSTSATPRQPQPPQSAIAPTRRRRSPRPLPPLPPLESRLPDTLYPEIYSLKVSNLPIAEIKTRDDVSSLFPRHLLPDAVILHRPVDPDDVSRTAYVGWAFDFEKRTEAMQEVIRVRMGRWRAVAEFVESEKPKWEWGDLAKVTRQLAWKVWNEKEQEREEEKEEALAQTQENQEDAVMVEASTDREHSGEGGYLVPPEPVDVDILPIEAARETPPAQAPPRGESEQEAIVLDSPALPPIPSRAPSRAGSSRNDPWDSPKVTQTPSRLQSAAPQGRIPGGPEFAPSRAEQRTSRPSASRPSSPRTSPHPPMHQEQQAVSSPPHTRDLPPHIARSTLPARPSQASASSREATPSVPSQLGPSRLPPQTIPTGPSNSVPSPRGPPASSRPRAPPSLLARTTELEVRGSAPIPSPAAQAKKGSLADRLGGNGSSSNSSLSERLSTSTGPRGVSPSMTSNQSNVSSGQGQGGGGSSNGNKGKGKQNATGPPQGSNPKSEVPFASRLSGQNQAYLQSQQQQQHSQQKGKKRAANNDFDSQDPPTRGGRGGGGGPGGRAGGGGGNSILDRIEGTANGQGQGSAKKAKNNPSNGGGGGGAGRQSNSRDAEQGGSSLLSRLG